VVGILSFKEVVIFQSQLGNMATSNEGGNLRSSPSKILILS